MPPQLIGEIAHDQSIVGSDLYLKSTRKREWTMSKHVIIDLSFSSQPPNKREDFS